YVTHDQVEAISMADRMAIMKDGVFVQVGTPREIYQYPADPFVASFVGETNFITGNIQEISNGKATIETPVGVLHTESVHHDFTPGQEVSCSIRPETIHLNGNSVPNQLTAKVGAVTYLGRVEEYELSIADSLKLKAIIHNPGTETKKPGDTVNISMSPKAIVPLPTDN
ncbi:MAG: TOBE domain-containing protein, partial [Candidatus Poribacteria bacterium]|nr:TOBE domain-containing protein [Candidatus Poribacteria bacterium]